MTYTGTMRDNLIAVVDNVLELSRKAQRERENLKLCALCRRTLGEHSFEGHFCPNLRNFGPLYRISQFREMRCLAAIGRAENTHKCEQDCIPGTEFCTEHSQEE